jgi:opacity protein-like surface antigen
MKTISSRLGGKALLLITATIFATPSIQAQDESARFGIKLAPNLAWLRSDTKGLENSGTKLGYTFGLNMEFPVGTAGTYRFATGVFLNNVGGKYEQKFTYRENATGPELTKALGNDVKLGYVEIPLTMKLMTNEIGYMRYFGQIGFGAAFNIRAKGDYDQFATDSTGFVTGFTRVEDEDLKDIIQPFKASLIVGAGMEYNFSGSTTLQAGVTYNNGFTNVLKKVEVDGKKAKLLQDYIELNLAVFF